MKNARSIAVEALCRQEEGGYSNLVWNAVLKKADLPERDAAFAGRIFYGTLEKQLTLDYLLQPFLKRPLEKLDGPVRAILRSGLYQARYMQVPASAAVNEAVSLARQFRKSSAAGMVNAVLRRACGAPLEFSALQSEAERISVQYSVGLPVVNLLLQAYGQQTEALVAAMQSGESVAVRVNTLRTSSQALEEDLRREGVAFQKGPLPGCLLLEKPGDIEKLKCFTAGKMYVQGVPSQLAALCVQAQPGETVLDLCAAPGGKSITLANQMQNTGRLYSCDVSENRVSLLEKSLKRCGVTNAQTAVNDASVYQQRFAAAQRILLDVPCSGLGTMAKKPDIRYKDVSGLAALTQLQAAILEAGAKALAPGGRLVYSTCTVLPQENENQIKRFLAQHPDFFLKPLPFTLQGLRDTGAGWLSLPDRTGYDGFFVCVMEREK